MDPILGVPLSSLLQEDGLSVTSIQSICKQIVEILLFLHNKSVVHKDLCVSVTFIFHHSQHVYLNILVYTHVEHK